MSLAQSVPTRREAVLRRLRLVESPTRRRRPRVAYAIVAVAGALAIGAAQMSLSILTTETTYDISRLASEQRSLTWQKQILHDDLAGLSSPQFLAANATALGMIINESPSYLRLSDGALLGTSAPAVGASSVDALSRAAVPNALITDTPLVTDPDATIEGPPASATEPAEGAVPNTPPPLTEGLPTPHTH